MSKQAYAAKRKAIRSGSLSDLGIVADIMPDYGGAAEAFGSMT